MRSLPLLLASQMFPSTFYRGCLPLPFCLTIINLAVVMRGSL